MQEYKLINLIFIFLLSLLFAYSLFFKHIPSSAKIKSNCKGNIYCKSEGLTRAFNSALHGEFTDAEKFNSNYISILSFFSIQFILRILFFSIPTKYINQYKIISKDIIITIILFLSTFYVFLF